MGSIPPDDQLSFDLRAHPYNKVLSHGTHNNVNATLTKELYTMSTPKLNLNKKILALFSGQESMVTTPKLYIQLTGSHTLAIVLSQCIYWSDKSECDDGWFYKRYDEWFEEIHIPERTLRRRFDHLEIQGWITTKVKKVRGINIKHIHPNMDLIIESLNTMLNNDCSNRPNSPVRKENEQKTCTKFAPTGQIGRSEPAKLSDSSIYTEDYNQKKLTTTTTEDCTKIVPAEPQPVVVVVENIFSKTLTARENSLLSSSYRDNPFKTQNIKNEDDFLNAALYSLLHRDKNIMRSQRLKGIVKLVGQGLFEEPIGWAKQTPSFNFTKKQKTPDEYDFKFYEEEKLGYEWVGDFIEEQFKLDRLDQEYFQHYNSKRKGYGWVGEWMERKGLKLKQK